MRVDVAVGGEEEVVRGGDEKRVFAQEVIAETDERLVGETPRLLFAQRRLELREHVAQTHARLVRRHRGHAADSGGDRLGSG